MFHDHDHNSVTVINIYVSVHKMSNYEYTKNQIQQQHTRRGEDFAMIQYDIHVNGEASALMVLPLLLMRLMHQHTDDSNEREKKKMNILRTNNFILLAFRPCAWQNAWRVAQSSKTPVYWFHIYFMYRFNIADGKTKPTEFIATLQLCLVHIKHSFM